MKLWRRGVFEFRVLRWRIFGNTCEICVFFVFVLDFSFVDQKVFDFLFFLLFFFRISFRNVLDSYIRCAEPIDHAVVEFLLISELWI